MYRFNSILCISLCYILLASNEILAAPPPPLNATAGLCGDSDYHNQIRTLWAQVKPVYQKWIKESADTPYNLYNIQTETNNLLKYAGYCQDLYILDELAAVYLGALDTLDEADDYIFSYYPGSPRRSTHKLHKKHQMWLDNTWMESILVSSQFLYLVSEALNIISKIEAGQHTPAMKDLLTSYPQILLDHYDRWIFDNPGPFQVRGWGCKVNGKYVESGMNHQGFITKKLHRHLGDHDSPSYCNAVTDTDMWIISGITNLLSYQNNKTKFHISPEKYNRLINYIRTGGELFKSRVTYKPLQDWNGKLVQGANFDLCVWDEHPDYTYAGYTGLSYPKDYLDSKAQYKANGTGWDLSHARRFVHVFDTLYNNKELVALDFPSLSFMTQLSNQLIYGNFNGDFTKPLFTNFMDGTNGWYRVGYEKRVGYGYGPWDMSIAVLTGGYGFWMKYNPDYKKLFTALERMVNSKRPEVQQHLSHHYEQHGWSRFKRHNSLNFQDRENNKYTQRVLLQFIPSLCLLKNE